MKKRAMKKYIPEGIYCHGHITKINKMTVQYGNSCPWQRWGEVGSIESYCVYCNSFITDSVKECGVKYD